MPGGRPTTYRPEYCERVIELGKLGKLPAQMASALECTKTSLHEWARVHPEFSSAFNEARGHAESWYLEKSAESAVGDRNGNATLLKFMLSAAFGYRETSGVEHSGRIESKPVSPEEALKAARQAEIDGEI